MKECEKHNWILTFREEVRSSKGIYIEYTFICPDCEKEKVIRK